MTWRVITALLAEMLFTKRIMTAQHGHKDLPAPGAPSGYKKG